MFAAMGRWALAAILFALWSVPGAKAGSVVIIGNEPETDDGTLSAVASLYGNYAKAIGFTMGAESYDLASVSLRLMEQSGSASTLSVSLFGGTASAPSGAPLVGFDTPAIPSVAGDVTFTPTAPFELRAGTTYWLEVSGQSNTLNGIVWYASSPGVAPSGVATSTGALFSDAFGTDAPFTSSGVMNTFQILGSDVGTVPEPAALIQGGLAVAAGLIYACWRQRRRRASHP